MADTQNVLVYGSCVARDTMSVFEQNGFNLTTYVARQSIISVSKEAESLTAFAANLASSFQRRMFRGDLLGDLFTVIADNVQVNRNVLVLWDLTDERCGVLSKSETAVFTRSQEAISSGAVDQVADSWELHPFGSLSHRLQFVEASNTFKNVLQNHGIWDKTFVLAVPWASLSAQGHMTPTSYGFDAQEANEIFEEYYDFLEMEGWKVVRPKSPPLADDNHRWGLAPFHYTGDVYADLYHQIVNHLKA